MQSTCETEALEWNCVETSPTEDGLYQVILDDSSYFYATWSNDRWDFDPHYVFDEVVRFWRGPCLLEDIAAAVVTQSQKEKSLS